MRADGLLSWVFTPKKMMAIEPKVRELCARSLDPLVGTGEFEDEHGEHGRLSRAEVLG